MKIDVDLWDYVERGVESSHTLTFFYTERGASGSTCYMRYTLPSVTAATDIGEVSALHFNPKILKTVEGTEDKETFEFSIRNTGTTEGVAMPSNTTCTVNGAGEGIFNMISFVRPGTYQFEITEVDGYLPGYIYDDTTWTLTVKVGLSGGTLYAESIEYSNPDGTLTSTKDFLKGKGRFVKKLFWHGSRTENWWNILRTGLVLRPTNVVINGKMFGYGLYFAPKARKSVGYTSLRGSYWAGGYSNYGFLALCEVAYGKPYDVYDSQQGMTWEKLQKVAPGCSSLHAHAGRSLRNDEVIVYREDQVTIKYLVELKAR